MLPWTYVTVEHMQVPCMTNEHTDANEQVQSNFVAKDHQQSNVLTIKKQVQQSFVDFIPPIVQH